MIFILALLFFFHTLNAAAVHNKSEGSNGSTLPGIEFPDQPNFISATSLAEDGCQTRTTTSRLPESSEAREPDERKLGGPPKPALKLHLKNGRMDLRTRENKKESQMAYIHRDQTRIQTLHRRIAEKKNQNTVSRTTNRRQRSTASTARRLKSGVDDKEGGPTSQMVATLRSGVSLGSVEYLMDVFLGTPPKHFSMIVDTGSDLNWIQCLPCHDCFPQHDPLYNPEDSSSFHNVSCHDPRCKMVSSPDHSRPCKLENQTCEYFYWYGDSSNTTGDFALETFTVNLTTPAGESELQQVENIMFGCGHWNRGHFNGASGLLGLGRGPLSFSSQLQSLYGHVFSYCLVDWNSDANVSSKLIFGEDKSLMSHPNLNFTSFVEGKENPFNTYYYLQIQAIVVGGEILDIPAKTWNFSPEGTGGMIIDSGTTLGYFANPAYRIIREAFRKKVSYPLLEGIPMLDTCFNVSGVKKVDMPEFTILFGDGAVWNFPMENCFIPMDPDVVCLAISETPHSLFSILGNYQQQNFHILYDTKKSRLGFAPMRCADV
ncbi:aspartic proteinase nepenthesin-2-like [Magnolia sinica]|uniref:aspartic proteinase nepenthesin-2-like n=1 Tax=Magnolia sinica TaxID=86752 RepID=UPI00265A4F6C|nr:aspartic proteinase nepenthesin-2-like [Magnolia sinica]